MRKRLSISVVAGVASGALCWFLLRHFHQGAADFGWAIRAAQYLLRGRNPYDTPLQQYPATAAVFALPFVLLSAEMAAGIFFGLSSALLAFGVTAEGYEGLLVFFAYPYWAAMLTAQWSPLILAAGFLPWLLPAAMAKPQVGFPVAFTRMSRTGLLACLAVLAATLLWMPSWPLLWWLQLGNYQHFFPLLVLPGPLLLLALLRWRDRDAVVLLLMAVMPQRWFFDAFVLWLIPKTRREWLAAAGFSWGAGIWRWYHQPQNFTQVGRWAVLWIYLPMLGIILFRKKQANAGGQEWWRTSPGGSS